MPEKILSEESQSVQAHLNILQGVIQRMATNSTSCKAWAITVVSAVLVIVADKGKPEFAWIALLPTVLFAGLDIYYLAMEKAFRKSYRDFVAKLHGDEIAAEDLYEVNPAGNMHRHQLAAAGSYSEWGFYLPLLALIIVARYVVLAG